MNKKLLLPILFVTFFGQIAFAQTGSITGTVTNEEGEPIPTANVLLVEISRGAATTLAGEYTIENVEPGTYTLKVTFVGYTDYTGQVTITADQTLTQNVVMQFGAVNLEELVVVGFGTTQREDLTGAVSSVTTEALAEIPNATFEEALQGEVAGVQVTSTSGVLGAPIAVRVRGTTSINASSQPLYVVDGVPLTNAGGSLGAGLGGVGTNPYININPNNIKSIQVLKSASAIAVYGSRGANGVVLIETKDGIAGKTIINIGTSFGYSEPTERYKVLSGPQFQKMANYALEQVNNPVLTQLFRFDPAEVPNTRWADLVTRTGTVQSYNASVSGGNEQTRFYLSGKYSNEEGYLDYNRLQQFNAFAKVDHSYNDQLDLGLKLTTSRSENFRVATSNAVAAPYTYAALQAPVVPQFYPNGEINDATDGSRAPTNIYSAFSGTPYSNLVGTDFLQTVTQILTSTYADYSFTDNLAFRTDFAVQYLQVEEEQKLSDFTTDGFPSGAGNAGNQQRLNYNWNNILTYTNDWDDHSLTAVVAFTLQHEDVTFISVSGNTFLSNKLKNIASAAVISAGNGTGSSFAFQNNLARVNYQFKDRYLVTLTASYNGSSRFGSDKQYGFFPAASAGWVISEESFLENADWLSFLKLRGGYGITGSASIANFANLALLGGGANYNNFPGLTLNQLANPDLQWERTAQFDMGLDYGFIDNRVRGSINYYNKYTTDLLLGVPISETNGFTSFTKNIGEIQNTGFGFDITVDVLRGDFLWALSANVSTINNEVKKLPNSQDLIFSESLVREGEPVGTFYVREFVGVDNETGDALYSDGEGGVTNDYNAAPRKVMGSPFPDYFGGFGTQLAYGAVSLNIDFQFSLGNEIFWSDGQFLETNLSSVFNQSVSQLDYWTPENKDATIPEPRFLTANGSQSSSRYLEDGSYLRLKSAKLAFTLPREWVSNYVVQIYAQGTNLLTFDNFPGLDPEVTPSAATNVQQGNVFFMPPQQRTVLFGVNLQF